MSLGCRIPFNFLASIATALFALCANASPITLNYTASLSFDPNATIAAGGINAGDVIDEIFGPGFGSAGTVPVTGSVTYESGTPVLQQSTFGSQGSAANYLSVITAAEIRLGTTTANADIGLINGSPSTGQFVTVVNSRGFCIAVSFTTRDTLGLVLGGTTASPEFAPILSTGVVGDVFAEALFFAVVGNPGENLWSSSALPNSSIFFDPARIDATVISIALTGPNLTSPLVLEGNASRLDVSGPTPIPEPGTFLLVGIATAFVVWKRLTATAHCPDSTDACKTRDRPRSAAWWRT